MAEWWREDASDVEDTDRGPGKDETQTIGTGHDTCLAVLNNETLSILSAT